MAIKNLFIHELGKIDFEDYFKRKINGKSNKQKIENL